MTALAFLFFSLLRAIALVFGKAQANASEKRLESNRLVSVMIHAIHVPQENHHVLGDYTQTQTHTDTHAHRYTHTHTHTHTRREAHEANIFGQELFCFACFVIDDSL